MARDYPEPKQDPVPDQIRRRAVAMQRISNGGGLRFALVLIGVIAVVASGITIDGGAIIIVALVLLVLFALVGFASALRN